MGQRNRQTARTMKPLSPLIELATHKSLDLFFRTGQGYVARSAGVAAPGQRGQGLSPLGIQSRAQTRIVACVKGVPSAAQPYARPGR